MPASRAAEIGHGTLSSAHQQFNPTFLEKLRIAQYFNAAKQRPMDFIIRLMTISTTIYSSPLAREIPELNVICFEDEDCVLSRDKTTLAFHDDTYFFIWVSIVPPVIHVRPVRDVH